jgi:pilus assembly protein Flp/PilA
MAHVVMNVNIKFLTEIINHCFPGARGSFFIHTEELMMNKMVSAVKAFVADENGVTAIEYGLIAALVGVVIVGAVKVLGTELKATFNDVVTNLGGTPAP